MKVRKKVLKFPVWGNYRVHIIAANDIKKYMSEHREFSDVSMDGDDEYTGAITLHKPGNSVIILPLRADISTIAHESYHAVKKILDAHDAELDNEVVAYHLGYIAEEVFLTSWGKR